MERKFYPENFERFLRGHADQFKMSPSKKVWHGIYNDLHPGRRWPSIAMTMVFIFTLVIVGHLNTNNGNTQLYDLTAVNNPAFTKDVKKSVAKNPGSRNFSNRHNFNKITINRNGSVDNTALLPVVTDIQFSTTTNPFSKNENKSNATADNPNDNIENRITYNEKEITKTTVTNNQITPFTEELTFKNKEESLSQPTVNKEIILPADQISNISVPANAVNNKAKRKNNVTWAYYITPSLSYRNFSDENMNNSVIHRPRIGYEAGTAMSFNIYKKLQFSTGIQLNYSGYNIKANNAHPTMATLALNSEIPGQFTNYFAMSTFGNNTGSELSSLKNYSFQASLPIGLQYVFAENDNIKFGAAAAFQPSIVLASKSYLLSTDKRNYLTASDLVRNLNMSTNFTTYVSFESNTLNWQIGPQVRYQLLSTYSNRYPIKEHLVNYGIRLGISKISK
jgi:hypothetical protein